jgi:hypothetical protein
MAFEQLRAEIAMLVQQMDNEPEDIHELHARIRSKLNEIKAMGMPLPDDLVVLERRLDGQERRASRQDQSSGTEPAETSPRRAGRRKSAKRAKQPAKAAKAAKKARGSAASKSKRPAAKAAKKGRGSAAKKSKRPARTARKSRGSAAKKSQRTGRRRR